MQPEYKGGTICRAGDGEESPDREGHLAAEIADGSNLVQTVTENNRRKVRVKTRGKSPRRMSAMPSGYGDKACKTKYTDR